jgi:hypothetical protein
MVANYAVTPGRSDFRAYGSSPTVHEDEWELAQACLVAGFAP